LRAAGGVVLLLVALEQPLHSQRHAQDYHHEQRSVAHKQVEALQLEREVEDDRRQVEELQRVQRRVEQAENGGREPVEC
jgi:hypothetical protein